MRLAHPMVSAALALLAACGGSSATSSTGGGGGGRTTNITVGNDFFSPTPDTVTSGAAVTWTWSTPSDGHTVNWDTSPGALPSNSGAAQFSGTYLTTLSSKGTYTYHCTVHGLAMSGTIVVQ